MCNVAMFQISSMGRIEIEQVQSPARWDYLAKLRQSAEPSASLFRSFPFFDLGIGPFRHCLLYTSDAADEMD